jgi:hypothetical protein
MFKSSDLQWGSNLESNMKDIMGNTKAQLHKEGGEVGVRGYDKIAIPKC